MRQQVAEKRECNAIGTLGLTLNINCGDDHAAGSMVARAQQDVLVVSQCLHQSLKVASVV